MSAPVSIRNTKELQDILREGREIPMNDEIAHNSEVIAQILSYAPLVLPEMGLLTSKQFTTLAQSAAYILRTDSIYREDMPAYFMGFLPSPPIKRMFSEDGLKIHFRNDPSLLTPNFELRDFKNYKELEHIGAEFFRTYSGAVFSNPEIEPILVQNGHMGPIFNLADVTAFLLTPTDLIDYHYTKEELNGFAQKIDKYLRTV